MTRIGVKIREAREYIGMTQEELAKKLGYRGKSSIAKIETGANDIPISKVKEFADALHTTPAFLMTWQLLAIFEKWRKTVVFPRKCVVFGVYPITK